MSSGIKTFYELQEQSNYTILMPIYQRDYVQGRGFDFEDEIYQKYGYIEDALAQLISDIKNAVANEDAPPLNLNFVYGKKQGDALPPIDGQQRLTTLFLLHLYAFWKEGDNDALKKTCQKFQYKTRESAEKFLAALREHIAGITISSSDQNLIKEIRDQHWFQSEWFHDLSVRSMLYVLQKIHKEFYGIGFLSQKLKYGRQVVVSFLDGGSLNTGEKNLKIDEDLYIKLNARGRPLSDFENFKADILNEIVKIDNTTLYKNFSTQINGDFLSLFWQRFNDKTDDALMELFHWFFACKVLLTEGADENKIVEFQAKRTHFRIKDYGDLVTIETLQVLIEELIAVMDAIYTNQESVLVKEWLFEHLANRHKITGLENIALFHAFCELSIETNTFDEAIEYGWFRIINNLVKNTEIERRHLQGVLKIIHSFRPHAMDLLAHFRNAQLPSEPLFRNPNGYVEEKRKAELMADDDGWKIAIKQAESIHYLKGQIWGILQLSKTDGIEYLERFQHYVAKINYLFDNDGVREDIIADFRRALLYKGDFSIDFTSCKCFVSRIIVARWHIRCWKYLLNASGQDESIVNKRKWFGELLDEIDFDNDIPSQLEQIAQNVELDESDWRYHFIKTRGVMSFFGNYGNYGVFQEINNAIILVPGTGTNGKNLVEYKTYALYCELKNIGYDEGVEYEANRRKDINKMGFNLQTKGVDVRYRDGQICVEKNENEHLFDTVTDAFNFIIC